MSIAASADNLSRKVTEPKGELANVHLGLLHPVRSALSFPEDVFGRNLVLETGRQEGAGVLHLENLKVSELARDVSKKPSPV